MKRIKKLLSLIGPGVVTGASDDDPSGIATYSIAGARAGYSTLWTTIFTLPLMSSIQEMSARIGLVTGKGLVGVMRLHYPRVVVVSIALLVTIANIINIGADIAGMSAASKLIFDINPLFYSIFFTLFIIATMVFIPYHIFSRYLKWLTLVLFTYIFTVFIVKPDWTAVLFNTIVPQISLTPEYIILIVAIFGTTISPYLFFWQANEEVEEIEEEKKERKLKRHIVTKHELKNMRGDVTLGMSFSNLVMYFIIATTASTLFASGITDIQTADQAASALKPLAGEASSFLFALGIVGTGLLAIPILAGSAAYAFSEAFGLVEGMNKKFREAKMFYLIIILATIIGFFITLSNINPFDALFYTALLYGFISPILILFILHIANKKSIMGNNSNGRLSNILGLVTFFIMTGAILLLVFL